MQIPSPRFRSKQYFAHEISEEIKCFTQIYRHLYGDATLVPIRTSTNMAAEN